MLPSNVSWRRLNCSGSTAGSMAENGLERSAEITTHHISGFFGLTNSVTTAKQNRGLRKNWKSLIHSIFFFGTLLGLVPMSAYSHEQRQPLGSLLDGFAPNSTWGIKTKGKIVLRDSRYNWISEQKFVLIARENWSSPSLQLDCEGARITITPLQMRFESVDVFSPREHLEVDITLTSNDAIKLLIGCRSDERVANIVTEHFLNTGNFSIHSDFAGDRFPNVCENNCFQEYNSLFTAAIHGKDETLRAQFIFWYTMEQFRD